MDCIKAQSWSTVPSKPQSYREERAYHYKNSSIKGLIIKRLSIKKIIIKRFTIKRLSIEGFSIERLSIERLSIKWLIKRLPICLDGEPLIFRNRTYKINSSQFITVSFYSIMGLPRYSTWQAHCKAIRHSAGDYTPSEHKMTSAAYRAGDILS